MVSFFTKILYFSTLAGLMKNPRSIMSVVGIFIS
jgi:hypothetical protein